MFGSATAGASALGVRLLGFRAFWACTFWLAEQQTIANDKLKRTDNERMMIAFGDWRRKRMLAREIQLIKSYQLPAGFRQQTEPSVIVNEVAEVKIANLFVRADL